MSHIHLALDNDELATVIAALRTYQEAGYGDPYNRPERIHEIAADDSVMSSLDDAGIDALIADKLNISHEPKTLYAVMQEGGSSGEGYLHLHETEEDAEADRESCEEDGSYRTSAVFTIASYPGDFVSLDDLIQTAEYAAQQDYDFPA
ncbi:hypothetical protein J7355_15700 [Endozoicomonas sp. G2_2]|uniref:hypothetical protein n=1 Tax=Endozoicomonas sp. G2_2 TaxID=2821092 RepID=UPI001ADA1833|nr:hypothetical protein [Endozoicomonas sp. G2_2]MBO9471534.1 hypothetical protein [Endozoicomonas sp. G2_2]